jgi:hypothetical protein
LTIFSVILIVIVSSHAQNKSPSLIKEKNTKNYVVLARVNDWEISLKFFKHQLTAPIRPIMDLEIKKKVLNEVIRKRLLANAAIEEGIDRDPNVIEAIEYGKMTILAQTFSSKISEKIKISEEEMQKFYNDNKNIFVTDAKEEQKTFAEVKNHIKEHLKSVKLNQMLDDIVIKMRKKSDIKINEELLQ